MSKSDVQSASVAPITVPLNSKNVNNAPSANSDTSSNRNQDTKTDSLERFRQFHQLRRENQTARLRQLQALEDQLTGATSSNQHRQRSLLSNRGDGRLRTTSLIHDDRKPKVVVNERSSDDSDIRNSWKKKPNYAWRLSNLENVAENDVANNYRMTAKQEQIKKSKPHISQSSHKSSPAKEPVVEKVTVRSEPDTTSISGKRNTLQDLERLIAESARRLTESRKSIDELIQSHEIDTSKRFSGQENYNLDSNDLKGEHGEESSNVRVRNSNNVMYNETMESKSGHEEAKISDALNNYEGLSNRISPNQSASPHDVPKGSLNTEREDLSLVDTLTHSSDRSADTVSDLTSMEAKDQNLLPAPLRPSSLHMKHPPSTMYYDSASKKSSEDLRLIEGMLNKTTSSHVEEPKRSPPKVAAHEGRSSLRKPQAGKSKLTGASHRESDTVVDWMSSDIDTFQNDLHASKRHETSKQMPTVNDDIASTSLTSSLSKASVTSSSSVSSSRTRQQVSKKRMSGTKQTLNGKLQESPKTKVLGESDSEDEALVRKNKTSNTPKPIEVKTSESAATNNPYRRSLKGSPSLEHLVRTKKISIHQPAAEASKVKESMHGSFVGRTMSSKTSPQNVGHRKRGKVKIAHI